MSTIRTSLLVAACIFCGGVGGLYLHRFLPREHLTRETLDVIKLGTGMLSVLASLVLGLLIATAKTSHDSADLAIRNYAAELALLNEALRDYGGPASVSRDLLREYVEAFERQGWPRDGKRPLIVEDEKTRVLLEQVRDSIRALKPVDAEQQALQNGAVGIHMNLLRQRWLLIEQQGPSVQRVVLVVLVTWVTVNFCQFRTECSAKWYGDGGVPDLLVGDRGFDFPHPGDGSSAGWRDADIKLAGGQRSCTYELVGSVQGTGDGDDDCHSGSYE
jgi:hypothetical protein